MTKVTQRVGGSAIRSIHPSIHPPFTSHSVNRRYVLNISDALDTQQEEQIPMLRGPSVSVKGKRIIANHLPNFSWDHGYEEKFRMLRGSLGDLERCPNIILMFVGGVLRVETSPGDNFRVIAV